MAAAALLVPIVPFLLVGELPGDRWLSATDGDARLFALAGAALLASDVLLPVPSSILGTLLGARLGLPLGFLCAWSGLLAGNLIGYGIGRLLPGAWSIDLPRTPGLLVLFASRAVPVLAEAVALTSGAARMPLGTFLAGAASGNAVYALALAANGAALLPDALLGPGLLVPMALPVAAWLTWRWLARRHRHLD